MFPPGPPQQQPWMQPILAALAHLTQQQYTGQQAPQMSAGAAGWPVPAAAPVAPHQGPTGPQYAEGDLGPNAQLGWGQAPPAAAATVQPHPPKTGGGYAPPTGGMFWDGYDTKTGKLIGGHTGPVPRPPSAAQIRAWKSAFRRFARSSPSVAGRWR